MSHKTRFEAEVRDLKRRGVPPDAPEAIETAARFRAQRIVHPPKPRVIDVRRDVEAAVKRRIDATTPLTAPEAIALLLKIGWQAAILTTYLVLLPGFRAWRWLKARRKPRPAPAAAGAC